MVREVVKMACEERSSLEIVGEAADGHEAISLYRTLQPNVIVLDLGLPGRSGYEVLRQVREESSDTRIIVLTGQTDPSAVYECLRLGADGFVEKTGSVDEIAAAVEAVADGTQVFSIEHQRSAHAELGNVVRRSREAARIASGLTGRERQVLGFVAEGLTTRQVATRMRVSPRTVEAHIRNLYAKLEVRSRMQAVHKAIRLGLIEFGAGEPSTGAAPVER